MNNSHLIGEGHLRPIARNGYVYEWDFTDIGNIVRAWVIEGSSPEDEPYKLDLGRLKPSHINIKKCTGRFACKRHDGPVFEGIDAGKLDPYSLDHQFLLGFRSAIGTLALYESVVALIQAPGDPEVIKFWKEEGKWGPLRNLLDEQSAAADDRKEEIKRWVAAWQRLYPNREQRGTDIVSSVKPFTPSIRVACSSLYRPASKPQFALSIIPSQDGAKATATVSSLKSKQLLGRLSDGFLMKRQVESICSDVVGVLENDPEKGVLLLAQETHHFLVNKEDYDSKEIISDSGRRLIEEKMAEVYGLSGTRG